MARTIAIAGLSVGVDRGSYVRHFIKRAVAPASSAASLAELLGSVHDYTDAHGVSEEEIGQFFGEPLIESSRERRRVDIARLMAIAAMRTISSPEIEICWASPGGRRPKHSTFTGCVLN